jgi:hypothetical protein
VGGVLSQDRLFRLIRDGVAPSAVHEALRLSTSALHPEIRARL